MDKNQKASLGCGTLILIGLIVMFFGNMGQKDMAKQIRSLSDDIQKLERSVTAQTRQIESLNERMKSPLEVIPTWPPKADSIKSEQITPSGHDVDLALIKRKDGSPAVRCTFAKRKEGYNVYLISVFAYSKKRFVGLHQRFEESGDSESGVLTMGIPSLPKGTDRIVIRYQSFAFDRKQWPAKRFSLWYRFTGSRFTTAIPLGERDWDWRFERGPVDCNLGRWLTDSKARFSRQTEATTVITKKNLPKQS
ncbi:MAG: hypothetical protein KAV00_05310 [Phycisphaerae bacterium]|nr:hypothetical protein [Phycisphaerae bacterium]